MLSLLVTLAALMAVVGADASALSAHTLEAGVGRLPGRSGVAAATSDKVVVVPTSVTPSVLTRRAPVTVTGTVTARLGAALSGASVRVVAEPAVVNQRNEVSSWATSERPARGAVLVEKALPPLRAGQTTSFSVTIPAGRISSGRAFAALPVSIEVGPRAGGTPVAVTHTFIAWNSRKEYVPIRVATLVPLTVGTDVDLYSRTEATRSAAWTAQLGPGSRVERILEGTKGSHATLAVDPSLFGPPAETPAGAGTPTGPPSTPTTAPTAAAASPTTGTTTGPTAAATPTATPGSTSTPAPTQSQGAAGTTSDSTIAPLVRDLTTELRDRSVWALPYADTDLAAAADVAPTNTLVRALVDRATEVGPAIGSPVRSNVFWPIDGSLAAAREKGLRTLVSGTTQKRIGAVVVSQAAVTTDSSYTPSAERVSSTGTPLLAFDNELSTLLPRGDTSAALSTQQFLAESLVLLGERPGTERSLLLAAPRDYDPDADGLRAFLRALETADWLTPVAADALLDDRGGRAPAVAQHPKPAPKATAPAPVLTAGRLAALTRQRDTILQVATVLRDGATFESTYREMLGQLTSARWRWAPSGWQKLNDAVISDTKAATRAIRVVPQGVNFLAAHGILRITVINGLDYTVDGIRLVVQPTNPRMTVEQPEPITIGPGAKTTVRVPATALAAGRVDIQAYLTTADGTPIGQPAVMRVSANPLDSTFYWTGAVLVGLVLLFGVVRTIRKGTSRVDEIGDLETVAAEVERHEHGEHS